MKRTFRRITTRDELKKARPLNFCYLCGRRFELGEKPNWDHVPPKAIFHKEDRDPPLKLPTHRACNEERSGEDEVLGQLIAMVHGTYPRAERVRLKVEVFDGIEGAPPRAGIRDLPFRRMIFRFARGFHAALYQTHFPDRGGMIYAPFPAYDLVNGVFVVAEEDPGRLHMTRVMRRQRIGGEVDRVECFNGKCVYECAWSRFDDGRPFCFFALRIYEWEVLGDPNLGPPRGCIGYYDAEFPEGAATIDKDLDFELQDPDSLDPFA